MTPNGKVDTSRLPNPFTEKKARHARPEGSQLAKSIASIWMDVVAGMDLSSFDENFFDAGGSSVDMLRVKKRLDTELGHKIPAVTLFTYPTVNKLAEHLGDETSAKESDGSSIRQRARKRRQQLSRRSRRR